MRRSTIADAPGSRGSPMSEHIVGSDDTELIDAWTGTEAA
jgi:hypothetical protein